MLKYELKLISSEGRAPINRTTSATKWHGFSVNEKSLTSLSILVTKYRGVSGRLRYAIDRTVKRGDIDRSRQGERCHVDRDADFVNRVKWRVFGFCTKLVTEREAEDDVSSARFSWALHPPDNSLPYRPIPHSSPSSTFSFSLPPPSRLCRACSHLPPSATPLSQPRTCFFWSSLRAFPRIQLASVSRTPRLPSSVRNSCEPLSGLRDFSYFIRVTVAPSLYESCIQNVQNDMILLWISWNLQLLFYWKKFDTLVEKKVHFTAHYHHVMTTVESNLKYKYLPSYRSTTISYNFSHHYSSTTIDPWYTSKRCCSGSRVVPVLRQRLADSSRRSRFVPKFVWMKLILISLNGVRFSSAIPLVG